MNLTREQQLALNYDRHIAVSANAGSGKTRILVDRYLKIIKDSYNSDFKHIQPYNVVALTFTKKAAAEMRSRLIQTIEQDILELHNQKNTLSPDFVANKLKHYNEIRRRLSYARVQTIHSFTNDMLRDFPIEAGLNPNFSDITDIEKKELKDEAITVQIEELLLNKNEDTESIIHFYSIKKINSILEDLLGSEEQFEFINKFFIQDDKTIKDFYINEFIKYIIHIYNTIVNIAKIEIQKEILSKGKTVKVKIETLDFIAGLKTIDSNDISDLQELAQKCDFDKFTKYKVGGSQLINYITSFIIAKIPSYKKNAHKDLVEVLNKYVKNTFSIDLYIEHSRQFFTLAKTIFSDIDEIKSTSGKIDFDDMIIKFNRLLDNEDVANVIRKEIKYLLVDEFQDTNQIQYNIIKKLVPSLSKEYDKNTPSPKLFIVGDDKQSIYGFRSSDVRVFKSAIKNIRERQNIDVVGYKKFRFSDEKHPAKTEELEGFISLNSSFRMDATLAAYINTLFNPIMQNRNQFEVNYSPLIIGRNTGELKNAINSSQNKTNLSTEFGKIEYLITEFPDKDEEINYIIEKKELEAHSVARKIIDLLDEGIYNAKDITILSTTSKQLTLLYNVLLKYKIPAVLDASKGFYKTREVSDILSILKFLINSNDDLALSALLKAPFFNYTDTDLLNIAYAKGYTFWEKMEYLSQIKNEEKHKDLFEKISKTIIILNNLKSNASSISIVRLIHTILYDTEWYKNTVGFLNRKQIYANVEKLCDVAYQYENIGFNNIYDFIIEIEQRKEITNEKEEMTHSSKNAVSLMTIHASKGLEFPVVVLFSPDYEGKKASSPKLINDKYGLCFKSNSQRDTLFPNEDYNINKFILAEYETQKIEAENKRLLYVALTRAESYLIISLTTSNKKDAGRDISGKGFTKYLQNIGNSTISNLIDKEINLIPAKIKILINKEYEEYDISFNIHISKYNLEDEDSQLSEEEYLENELETSENFTPIPSQILLNEIYGCETDFQFSATKLAKYKQSSIEYGKRFLLDLKIDSDDKKIITMDSEQPDHPVGTFTGIILHNVLEYMNDWYDFENQQIDYTKFNQIIAQVYEENFIIEDKKLSERINAEIPAIVKTKIFTEKGYDFINSIPEYELTMPFENDFLTGKLDLLIQDNNGQYEIWDWKSNTTNIKGMKVLAERYEAQMKLYTYFVAKLYPEQKEFKARLLFTKLAKEGTSNEEWIHTFIWTKSQIENFENELKELRLAIRNNFQMG